MDLMDFKTKIHSALCREHYELVRDMTTVDDPMAGGESADDTPLEEGVCEMDEEDSDFSLREHRPVCIDSVRKLFYDFARGNFFSILSLSYLSVRL